MVDLSAEDDEFLGGWEGQCQACDQWGPVDDMMLTLSSDIRPDLGVEAFTGAAYSRRSAAQRFKQSVMRPFLRRLLVRATPPPSE